jgi:hypothetical protein
MATRVNMLKLLQEVRGLMNFASRRPHPRQPGALFLAMRPLSLKSPKSPRKRIIRVSIQDPPDIPTPVKIIFLEPAERSTADAQ